MIEKPFPLQTGHLKKSFTQDSSKELKMMLINSRWINEKIEELRQLGYSDEYINRELGDFVNWRI